MKQRPLVTDLYGLGDFTNNERRAQWAQRYQAHQQGARGFRLLIINATKQKELPTCNG